jgi:hypothetical protein
MFPAAGSSAGRTHQFPNYTHTSIPPSRHSYASPHPIPNRGLEHKLHHILSELQKLDLSLGTFLYELFRIPGSAEKDSWTDEEPVLWHSRSVTVSGFLRGTHGHTPAQVIDLWYRSPYGRPHKDSPEMYTLRSIPYTDIRPVRPALTSFGLQVVAKKLKRDLSDAIKPSSGLQAHIPTKRRPVKPGVPILAWKSLGASTQTTLLDIHSTNQRILLELLVHIVTPGDSTGEDRKNRPILLVSRRVLLLT